MPPCRLTPAFEGDSGQLSGQIVGPAVIDAADLFDVAAPFETQQIAAMRAAVDDGIDPALRVARDDHPLFLQSSWRRNRPNSGFRR